MVIECGKPTEHYSSGRALLKAWDSNINRWIDKDETIGAVEAFIRQDGTLNLDELNFVLDCYMNYAGDIDAVCPPSSDWMYWLIVAGIAIIVLYMIGGKK